MSYVICQQQRKLILEKSARASFFEKRPKTKLVMQPAAPWASTSHRVFFLVLCVHQRFLAAPQSQTSPRPENERAVFASKC